MSSIQATKSCWSGRRRSCDCEFWQRRRGLSRPPDCRCEAWRAAKVVLSEGSIQDRQHKVVGPVEVSVKKLTLFHKDPTKELANDALIERARAMNADAVINIIYTTGIGLTTWGYIDAKGLAVKLLP